MGLRLLHRLLKRGKQKRSCRCRCRCPISPWASSREGCGQRSWFLLKELLVATSCMQLVFTRLMDLHMSVNCFGMIRQQAPGLPQLSMSGSKSDTRIHMGWDWVSTCFSSESPVILVRHADHKLGCRKLLPHTSTQAKHLPRRPNSSMPPPHWAATLGSTQHRSAGC